MSEEILQMTFDPNTIEHLGARMYTTLPPVLTELIANAYDADAENVILTLSDNNKEKEIIIEDDGTGMSFDEINKKFLRIGQNRRQREPDVTPIKNRKVIGKKGLGKLCFFGIAHEAEIITRKEEKETVFVMSWEKIKKIENGDYEPEIKRKEYSEKRNGTKIILRKIQRKTDFVSEQLAVSLSRMFIVSSDFKITVKHNEKKIVIKDDMKYKDLEKEVEWNFPLSDYSTHSYDRANQIKGLLIATKKPIKPSTKMRGITLFSRKKLVNNPEYFSNSTSSNFFNYLTGYLEVDFIDDLSDDVIATNRQSLNWDQEDMKNLQEYLKGLIGFLQTDWRKKRKKERRKKIKTKGIDIENWFSKLPEEHEIKSSVEFIVQNVIDESELSEEKQQETVEKVRQLVPEYPKYHWRHLHEGIKDVAREKYENKDYYGAFFESVKRYVNKVKEKSNLNEIGDKDLMGKAFSEKTGKLTVTEKFKKSGGSEFEKGTRDNIEAGQMYLSQGVVAGCRNPLAHEEFNDLKNSGLFTEKDCLDALSLLSHLFRRLDNAKKRP